MIIVTTKKGRKGQGLGISFNSNTVLERMVPYDQKDLQEEYGRGNNNVLYTAADAISNGNYLTGLSWGAKIQGQSFLDVDGLTKPYVAYTSKEQFDHFFKTGVTTTNSVALAGSSDHGTYRLSLSQTSDNAPIPTSGFSRYNAVFRATNDFGKRFHTDVKMDISRTQRTNIPLLRNDARGSFSLFFDRTANTTDVRLLDKKDSLGNYLYTYTNPYVQREKVVNNQTTDRIISALSLTYDITDHLHAQVQTGIDYSNIAGLFAIYPNNEANNTGQITVTTEPRERDNALGMLSYDNNFHKFSVHVNVGAQVDYNKTTQQQTTGNTFVVPTLLSLTNTTVNTSGISLYNPRSKVYSTFGSAQFGYDNYLFLELTARNDWYSTLTFANQTSGYIDHLLYPSANLSYVFSDALGLKGKVLDFGKLRASWGQTGGNLAPYLTNLTFDVQPTVNSSAGAQIYSSSLPPKTIRPEVTSEYELGTELKFFNSRLGLDFAWYDKTTKNFLVNSTLSAAAGFTSVSLNAGSMRNEGVEILVTGTPVQTRTFSWDISLNAARNRNKVLSLVPQLATTGIDNYYQIETKVGYPMGSIFGVPYSNAANGQPLYQAISSNGNGVLDAVVRAKGGLSYDATGKPVVDANGAPVVNNSAFLGSANPDWTAGITNTFTYKHFNLGFLIDGQFGGYIFEDGYRWASFFGIAKATALGRDGSYIPKGVVNTGTAAAPVYTANTLPLNPFQQYNGGGTLKYYADQNSVFKKTFIKFRQVSLGYTLPKALLSKTGFQAATFSLIGRNLFYFKKDVPMFDPQSSDSINNGFGYDTGGLPASRTYGFNLSLRF